MVSLCPSTDGEQCAPAGTPWHRGWIVFVNGDRDAPAVRDPDEDLLRVYAPWDRGAVIANRGHAVLPPVRPDGRDRHASRSATTAGREAARAVIISQTGRPRVSDRNASGSPLTCA